MPVANLWRHSPHLRRRARRQAQALRTYLDFERRAETICAGMGQDRLRLFQAEVARDVGYRAGRLMALRMEAYDRLVEEAYDRLVEEAYDRLVEEAYDRRMEVER